MATATATEEKNVMPLDFAVASQYSSRPSFDIGTVTLGAASLSAVSPIQIPAVGFLFKMTLKVTVTTSGGTTPAWTADGPFNAIESFTLRNASGVNLITPVTGYGLYLMNKWGGQTAFGATADPRAGINAPAALAASQTFFLDVPIGIDLSEGYGSIPALASNTNYQAAITFAAQPTVTTSDPTVTITVAATAWYFDVPDKVSESGIVQATQPPGMPAQVIWSKETPGLTPGTKYVTSRETGNLIRTHMFVLRNSSGARIDTDGWPALFEMYLNNNVRFSLTQEEFERAMQQWYGYLASTKDVVNGLDTGVYVLPYHAMLGSLSGDPANTRAQLLPTLDTSQVQFRGQEWGSAVSTLEIYTQSVTTTDAGYVYSK
jgi:hypothetical protein